MDNKKLLMSSNIKDITTNDNECTALEPISFAELSVVLGGAGIKKDDSQSKGSCGGLICWC